MKRLIKPEGTVRAIYDETIDLATLGRPTIARASNVEPDEQGRWRADLTPVGGPVLGPYDRRSEALEAEPDWLERHWLVETACTPSFLIAPFTAADIRPSLPSSPSTHPARPRRAPSRCAPAAGSVRAGGGGTGPGGRRKS